MRLAIFGTGGLGRETYDAASDNPNIVFVTDDPAEALLDMGGGAYAVIRPVELRPDDRLVLAVGDCRARKTVAERFNGQRYGGVWSDRAAVSPSAEIGDGAIILNFASIGHSARIGRHFQANLYAQVGHDCIVGDFVTLSPRATVNGWVEIGDGVFIGAGAVIRNGESGHRLKIGKGATIGMGAVVTKDVAEGATVMGVPAR